MILCIRYAVSAAWETAGVGILVYTMGPVKSRSLVMCHHFVIGLGFLVGPMLIEPFFPDVAEKNPERICNNNADQSDDSISNFDFLNYPYYILAVGHFICALGYILVIFTPYTMPGEFYHWTLKALAIFFILTVFEESQPQNKKSRKSDFNLPKIVVLTAIVIFYTASTGSERLFQTAEFVFGLCGPLKLSATDAVFTDETYNGGFMICRHLYCG